MFQLLEGFLPLEARKAQYASTSRKLCRQTPPPYSVYVQPSPGRDAQLPWSSQEGPLEVLGLSLLLQTLHSLPSPQITWDIPIAHGSLGCGGRGREE